MSNTDDPGSLAPQPAAPRGLVSPCPLCRYALDCPFDERHRLECLEVWPLARVARRHTFAPDAESERLRQDALRIPWVREAIRNWEHGGQVTDEQYLRLRTAALRHGSEDMDQVYVYVLSQFLRAGLARHFQDAVRYYRLGDDFRRNYPPIYTEAIRGALIIARDDMVAKDDASPVVSHFERLVLDALRILLRGMCGVSEITFPKDDDAFMQDVEREWARALTFGNGYFGLTIFPLVSILDMVRYQELGGHNKIISRSMVEQVIVSMDIFPLPVQLLWPEFRDAALKDRLIDMFGPLVGACAAEAGRRLQFEGDERKAEAYPRLRQEFRAVLSAAIDQYSFMWDKPGTREDAVGMLGFSASPELRKRVGEIAKALGMPLDVKDLTHLNATNFLGARLWGHVREYYPVSRDRTISLDQPSGAGEQTLADILSDRGEDRAADLVPEAFVPFTVNGVRYLYVDEMARAARVSADQLRRWDQDGSLKALRVRDVVKTKPTNVSANWRLYPDTAEMVEVIQDVARRKAQRLGDLAEGEYSRGEAAIALRISPKTLQRWESAAKARPERRNGRPIYSRDEIVRLDALAQADKVGPA